MWCDPRFKRRMKKEAVDRDMSLIDLTRECSRPIDSCDFIDAVLGKNNKKRKREYDFKI